ncbi:hypothetical protein [Mobilicoccus sp.]|uniref:hypothetical protein n=1 Tax=Mobilicoccus sp. TaxID=2034349 RepID=UPI0028ABECE4|nr:hypothetical protein [Mobilicoccus sp.]
MTEAEQLINLSDNAQNLVREGVPVIAAFPLAQIHRAGLEAEDVPGLMVIDEETNAVVNRGALGDQLDRELIEDELDGMGLAYAPTNTNGEDK